MLNRLLYRLPVVAGFGLIASYAAAAPAAATTCSSVAACVFGTNSSTGPGVQGRSSKGDGVDGSTSYGSTSASKAKAGVYGSDASTSKYNYGVFGSSSHGTGVHGTTSSGTGVSATATSSSGTALAVTAPAHPLVVKVTGNTGVGITINDNETENSSANAITAQSIGSAIIAGTEFGYIFEGYSGAEGDGMLLDFNDGTGLDIHDEDGDNALPLNITVAETDRASILSGDGNHITFDAESSGDLNISGHLSAAGGVNSLTARADGTQVTTYSPRDAEPVVEDVGETRVVNGAANVALDPAFAATLDPTRPYYVFLTPEGDNRGLFVGTRTMRGFTIRESSSGRSALGVQYRIVGKPLGTRERRLAAVDTSWLLRANRLRATAAMKRRQHMAARDALKRQSS